jgi:murein DD-endopeptidase MepM/ murein hydrolase activator NlpD
MELVESIKKSKAYSTVRHFPKSHFFAVSGLTLALGMSILIPSTAAKPERIQQPLDLSLDIQNISSPQAIDAFEQSSPLKVVTEKVRSGDNLSLLFKRAGLNDRHMMELLESNKEAKRLASIVPGHELKFEINEDNSLESITYIKNKLSSYTLRKAEDSSFQYMTEERTPDIHWAQREGTIEHSLYGAGLDAGMDDKLIMELAEVFGWDIDFALDIRKGDSFKVVYEEQFLDGEKFGHGAILSAEFTNQGQKFSAVRYVDSEGRAQYYSPDGKNMRKAFLRAPVDFRRISDGFNPRRLHPVTKRVRPHRGIDYAASTGTPVWSSGDGKVIKSGYSKYNGNYVVIQHGNNIQTKYLHLSKRHVKVGQRVRQKQIIGRVGATGLATGPHLHYEFLLNGVHRNPRTIVQKLPKAKAISDAEMARFLEQTQPLMAELGIQTTRLALKEDNSSAPAL